MIANFNGIIKTIADVYGSLRISPLRVTDRAADNAIQMHCISSAKRIIEPGVRRMAVCHPATGKFGAQLVELVAKIRNLLVIVFPDRSGVAAQLVAVVLHDKMVDAVPIKVHGIFYGFTINQNGAV